VKDEATSTLIGIAMTVVLFATAILLGMPLEQGLLYMCLCTAAFGVTLDRLLGKGLVLWDYPRAPYYSRRYWKLVPLAWAYFGLLFASVYFIVNSVIGSPIYAALVIWAILCIPQEVLGLYVRKSWRYNAPMWVVALGWIPLIATMTAIRELFL